MGKQTIQDYIAVGLVPKYLEKWNRIGRIARKTYLIHIDADTCNGLPYIFALKLVLQQDTADLFIVIVDIVGPFHAEIPNLSRTLLQSIDDSQRKGLAQ